ncbi:hypothetical protein M0R45_029547 [Rubus argutus]|uniref:Malectin-like domain-containing protein n=1 Tax=Rubus argutus TaxID=59490 RepID=A0AAW1WCC2_RUBAR
MNHPWYTFERLTFGREIQELDMYGRKWFLGQGSVVISTDQFVDGADDSPNQFPMALYQSAIVGNGGGLKFSSFLTSSHGVDVDIKHVYLCLHFAEIDPRIAGSRWRVFDIYVNGDHMYEVDISLEVGRFTAYFLPFFFSVTSPVLEVELRSQKGLPLICGMEIFLHIPGDSMVTNEEQANAMIAFRDDLILPRIMRWNGYPCAPSEWDTWEGIACTVSNNEMVIAEISLASRMIAGQLSAKIGDLESLTVLNLSHNMLNGRIPKELGKIKSLKVLDLSFNNFSGPVPKDILNLNISVNFLGNKYLCGPPFPLCRYEDEARLSIGSKIGIIIASALFTGLFILALRQAFTDGCIINRWKGRKSTRAAVDMVAIRND